MGNDVELKIGAKLDPLTQGLAEAKAAVSEAAESMRGAFEGVSAAFESISIAMAALTAVFAGGAAFREAISASQDAAQGALQLGRQLGITTTEASVLRVAMAQTGVPMEAVSAAANKIATAIAKNPAEFQRLGVAIKDSDGNLRNSFDIMTDVNTKLAELKEGTARNVEGTRIYGKAFAEVAPSIRLTAEAMEEARAEAIKYHTIVGQQGEAQSEAYRKAMARVHGEFEGISKSIGDALIPVLTKLADWFTSLVNLVDVVRGAMVGLYAIFERFKAVYEILEALQNALLIFGDVAVGAWNAIDRAMHLDFVGARAAWDKGLDNLAADTIKVAGQIKQIWDDSSKSIDQYSEKMAATETPTKDKKGGTTEPGDPNKTQMPQLEEELEAFKANLEARTTAAGEYHELSKAEEKAYWEQVLATTKLSQADQLAIQRKIDGETVSIWKDQSQAVLGELKNQETAAGQSLQKRLAAAEAYAAKLKSMYPDDVKAYEEAQRDILQIKNQEIKQEQELEAIRAATTKQTVLAQIATEEEVAKARYDMGAISMKQLIALEKQYEDQKYALELQALEREKALVNPNDDPVKYAQMLQQIQQLETQHNSAILKLDQQLAQQQGALWKQLEQTLSSGMASAFEGIIMRTETVRQAFTKLFDSMLKTVLDFIAKWLAQQLVSMAEQLIGIKTTSTAQAGQAAVAAMTSVAAIPYYGWAMAPEVGDSIFAQASGFVTAARGYDIPASINPIVQAHAEEMILPADIAKPLRKNLAGGGGSGVTVNANLVDARGMRQALRRGGVLDKEIRKLHRRITRQ